MAQLAPIHPITPSRPRSIPPLANGDHLTRAEFERRYDATPGLKKAELIEGIVFVPPPVSHEGRSRPHADLHTVLGVYRAFTPGVSGGDNGSIRFDLDTMPQPDAYLLIVSEGKGQAKIDADDYVVGSPELVAEIAATSASFDLHEKLRVYRRQGVKEYIIWRTLDRAFDYLILKDGDYQPLFPTAEGIFRSEVFPGLWIDAAALMKGNLAGALARVQEGLASPEHAQFMASLQSPRTTQQD